jgi:structural maintenance of chromosome 2
VTLTAFDNELKDLGCVIKSKKQALSDFELQLKKLEHNLQTLENEKTKASHVITNLEVQHEWITEETQESV